MNFSKQLLVALGALSLTLVAGPVLAGPFSDPVIPVGVSGVGVDWSQGEGVALNTESVYYAGPISMNLDTGTGPAPYIVFCDDLYNNVYIGGSYNYWGTDEHGTNDYLSPLSLSTAHAIAGLAFLGTADPILSPQQGAEIQVAIWELEYAGLKANDASFQADVDALIGVNDANALADYSNFSGLGWTYAQIESPCDPALAGSISYTATPYPGDANCQVQGQIVALEPGNTLNTPEPLTLSVFGAGIAGVTTLRRRKKKIA
jgi:hypothetical protein